MQSPTPLKTESHGKLDQWEQWHCSFPIEVGCSNEAAWSGCTGSGRRNSDENTAATLHIVVYLERRQVVEHMSKLAAHCRVR